MWGAPHQHLRSLASIGETSMLFPWAHRWGNDEPRSWKDLDNLTALWNLSSRTGLSQPKAFYWSYLILLLLNKINIYRFPQRSKEALCNEKFQDAYPWLWRVNLPTLLSMPFPAFSLFSFIWEWVN